MAHFADRAIAVRSNDLNEHAYAARAVSFKGHFFKLLAFELACAAQNGALDIVIRHVFIFCSEDGGAQAGLEFGSPPPMREAIVISRIRRVKTRPRLASVAAFLCLIVAHFECPDITIPSLA